MSGLAAMSLAGCLEDSDLGPWIGMAVSYLIVGLVIWFFARLLKKQARAAAGPAWFAASVSMLALYLVVQLLELLIGVGSIEGAFLGLVGAIEPLLPLHDKGLIGLGIYQLVLGGLYLLFVVAIWWGLVKGAHLDEADKAQSMRWLYRMAGRDREDYAFGPPDPGFASWNKTVAKLLGLALVVGFISLAVQGRPPTPGGWVVAELFVLGVVVNLVSKGTRAEDEEVEEEKQAEEAEESEPPPVPDERTLRAALADVGVDLGEAREEGEGDEPGSSWPADPAEHGRAALTTIHPTPAAWAGWLGGGMWRYQDELLVALRPSLDTGEPGRSTLVVGPRGVGRSTALCLVALDAALTRFEPALVLTATDADARRLAADLRRAIRLGPVPGLARVACPVDEAGSVGLGEPLIVVLPGHRLASDLTADRTIGPAFVSGVSTVVVDDLDRFDAAAATLLRLGLAQLRAERGDAPALTLAASAAPAGRGDEAWAAALLGQPVERLAATGFPRPACGAWRIRPKRGRVEPLAAAKAIEAVGLTVRVVDAVHGARGLSLAPWPCLEPPSGDEDADVTLVLARHRDIGAAALEAWRPIGADPRLRAVLVLAVDEMGEPAAQTPVRVPLVQDGLVLRERLLAALTAPPIRRRRAVEADFGAPLVAELEALAGDLMTSDTVAEVQGDDPPVLAQVETLSLREPREDHAVLTWRAPARTPLVAEPGGEVLGAASLALRALVHPPQASAVFDGARYRVAAVGRDEDRVVARRAGEAAVVRPRAELSIRARGESLAPPRRVRFSAGVDGLTVELFRVRVSARVVGTEAVSAGGRVEGLYDLEPSHEAASETVGFRLADLARGLDDGARTALEAAMTLVLTRLTTLGEDALLVAAHGDELWVTDLAVGGNGAARWLFEHLLGERVLWQAVADLLGRGAHPLWRLIRRDARPAEPITAPALRNLTSLVGSGSGASAGS